MSLPRLLEVVAEQLQATWFANDSLHHGRCSLLPQVQSFATSTGPLRRRTLSLRLSCDSMSFLLTWVLVSCTATRSRQLLGDWQDPQVGVPLLGMTPKFFSCWTSSSASHAQVWSKAASTQHVRARWPLDFGCASGLSWVRLRVLSSRPRGCGSFLSGQGWSRRQDSQLRWHDMPLQDCRLMLPLASRSEGTQVKSRCWDVRRCQERFASVV